MTLQELVNYVYQAMSVEFTVFGVTISYWSYFVFATVFGVIVWFINKFF